MPPPPQNPTQKVGNLPQKKDLKSWFQIWKHIGLHQINLGHYRPLPLPLLLMPGPRPARIAWLSPVVAAAAAREPESCERKRPTLDDTHSISFNVWIILNSDWTRKSGEIAIRHKHKLLVAGNHARHPRLFLLSAHWEPTRQRACWSRKAWTHVGWQGWCPERA